MSHTILIVDDEAQMRMLLRAFMEHAGHRVLEAACADDALELLKKEKVHLVISDMVMPGGSGLELLTSIRDVYPKLPSIILTGKPDIQAAVECMRVGALDYMIKPCDFGRLRDLVNRGIRAHDPTAEVKLSDMRALNTVDGYRLHRVLGEGTMGVVFLAEKGGESYALKIMKSLIMRSVSIKARVTRFLREVEIATKVRHPNIVQILDHGESEQGVPYFVMEFVEGESLADVIASPIEDLPKRIHYIKEIAEALSAIHKEGVVHRDLKPENILLNHEGSVKLADFGIAQISDSCLTATSGLMGSPAYMAPESFEKPKVTTQADLFSLGIIAYELLTGKPPFAGNTVHSLARAITLDRPANPREHNRRIPPCIVNAMEGMLQKRPEDRIATADEIVQILEARSVDACESSKSWLHVWDEEEDDSPTTVMDKTRLVGDELGTIE